MKTKKIVLNILASLGMVVLIFPMFLGLYGVILTVANKTSDPEYFKLFNDWSSWEELYKIGGKTFQSGFATAFDVLAIVLLCIAVLYFILFILQLAKVGDYKKLNKVKMFLALAALILTLIATALFIVFCLKNSLEIGTDLGILGKLYTSYTFIPAVGSILLLVGGLFFSIFGMIASKNK